MIGWKIVALVPTNGGSEFEEVVCEVVGMPFDSQGTSLLPVYHNKAIKMAILNDYEPIKVIDRNAKGESICN